MCRFASAQTPEIAATIFTTCVLKGDIYAVINYSMAAVSAGLNNPARWCDVMLLHINTKYCHAQTGSAPTRLRVNLGGKKPEALAPPNGKSFVHIGYSYRMNFAAQLAMSTYLGTVASGKAGFTVLDQQANGQNQYIGAVCAAWLNATPCVTTWPSMSIWRRLLPRRGRSFAVEQYPRQLHEMDRQEYVAMKRAENHRLLSMP